MSDATTEPKAKPPSLIEAIDFTNLVIKEQIKLILYAVERLASGIYTLDDTSYEPVIHGLGGLDHYIDELQAKLDEINKADRAAVLRTLIQSAA
jgi:hypothetical protein